MRDLRLPVAQALIAGLSLLLAGPALAGDDAMAQLVEMTNAVRQTNYDGVVVYSSGSRMETMRIVHGFDGEQERERLVSLTGDAREIVRDGDAVICVLPKQRAPPYGLRRLQLELEGALHPSKQLIREAPFLEQPHKDAPAVLAARTHV